MLPKIDECKYTCVFCYNHLALVTFGDIIGGGGQGIVQRGKLNRRDVALKSCNMKHSDDAMRFGKEIKLLR